MATTVIKGLDGKKYKLGSPEYSKYLLGTPLGTAATKSGLRDTRNMGSTAVMKTADELAAETNAQTRQLYDQTKDSDVDVRTSEKLTQELMGAIKNLPKAPEAPDLATTYSKLRGDMGLEPLETRLSEIDSELDRINVGALVGMDEAGDRQVSMAAIGKRRGAVSKEAQREAAFLNVERSAVSRIIGNKQSAVDMVMNFTQQDYSNASRQYEQEFSRATQMIDLFTKLEDREIAADDREMELQDRQLDIDRQMQQDAQANLTTMSNMIQESGKTFADLSSSQKTKVRQWELEAGYPEGTYEAFGAALPKSKVLYTSKSKDANGNDMVTFIYEDENGMPGVVESIYLGGGNGSDSGDGTTGDGSGSVPSWEEFVSAAEQLRSESGEVVNFSQEEADELRAAYDEIVASQSGGEEEDLVEEEFTATEKKKLQGAGLQNAPYAEQIKYLYPKKVDKAEEDERDF